MSRTPEFYFDFRRADVERLARAICVEQKRDPDSTVRETGYDGAALIPLWWRYQSDALKFIAMTKVTSTAEPEAVE